MEKFKPIKDYPDYEISDYGNVRSRKNGKITILKGSKCNGYLEVSLFKEKVKKRFLIHRLVASEFIRNMKEGEQVDHIDGDRKNNNLRNLNIVNNRINNLRKLKLNGAHKQKGRWQSSFYYEGKNIYIGLYDTAEEAHEAYKNKLKEYGISINFDKDMAYMLDDNTI